MEVSDEEEQKEDRKEDYCCVCWSYFYDEAPREQKRWAGCSFANCDSCRVCLPDKFDYDSDYFCDDHQLASVGQRVRVEP